MHFNKINQTYFIAALLMNERDLHKILRNIMLSHKYHIFRINSKKTILSLQ